MWLEHANGFVRLSSIEALVIQQSSSTSFYVEIRVGGMSVFLPTVTTRTAAEQQARDVVAAQASTTTV